MPSSCLIEEQPVVKSAATAVALTARKRKEVNVFMFAVVFRLLGSVFLSGGESEVFLSRKLSNGRQIVSAS